MRILKYNAMLSGFELYPRWVPLLSATLSLRCRDTRHLSFVSHVPLMFLYKQRLVLWHKRKEPK